MRVPSVLLPGCIVFIASVWALAADGSEADAHAAFARLKSLAGEWEAVDQDGKRSRLEYKIVASGSAVVERYTSDALPRGSEMLTVYHLDGDRLLLSHFCMTGNQPRMLATRFGSDDLEFEFLDATNMSTSNAGHMHRAKFRFIDDRHFVSEWQFFDQGAPKFTESAKYNRIR